MEQVHHKKNRTCVFLIDRKKDSSNWCSKNLPRPTFTQGVGSSLISVWGSELLHQTFSKLILFCLWSSFYPNRYLLRDSYLSEKCAIYFRVGIVLGTFTRCAEIILENWRSIFRELEKKLRFAMEGNSQSSLKVFLKAVGTGNLQTKIDLFVNLSFC